MHKLPLEKILGDTYRFLFSNFLSILGTAWLPLLLIGLLFAGAIYAIIPTTVLHGDFESFTAEKAMALIPAVIAIYPLVFVGSLVLGAMIAVGITQRALGMTQGPTFVYFSLGAPVWRMVGAQVLFYLGYMVFLCVAVALCVGVVLASRSLNSGLLAGLIDTVVIIGVFCFVIYAVIRVWFFLPAVVVAEEHISFSRAWELGSGNFWRIIVLALMIVIPVGIVTSMINQIFVMGSMGPMLQGLPPNPTPDETAEFFAHFLATLPVLLPALVVSGVIQNIAVSGLWYGAVGLSYRALVPASPPTLS